MALTASIYILQGNMDESFVSYDIMMKNQKYFIQLLRIEF